MSAALVHHLHQHPPKALLLDLDGVFYCLAEQPILKNYDAALEAYLIQHHGFNPIDAKTQRLAWYHQYGNTAGGARLELGVDATAMSDFAIQSIDYSVLQPCPQLRALLTALAARVTLHIATNAHEAHAENVLQRLGLSDLIPPNQRTTICQNNWVGKPEASFFNLLLQRTQCQPHEALFIDDSPFCHQGAHQMGITAVQVGPQPTAPTALAHLPKLHDVLTVVLQATA